MNTMLTDVVTAFTTASTGVFPAVSTAFVALLPDLALIAVGIAVAYGTIRIIRRLFSRGRV